MNFNVTFTKEELPGLRKVLDRAMNTWEPQDQPRWLLGLSERVDQALAVWPAPAAAAAVIDFETARDSASALMAATAPSKFGSPDLQALILDTIRAQQRAIRNMHQFGGA